MKRGRPSRTILIALVVSVLVHVLGWLWLRSLPPATFAAAPAGPLQIELTFEQPPPAPPAMQRAEAKQPEAKRPDRLTRAPKPKTPTPPQPPEDSAQPEPPPSSGGAASSAPLATTAPPQAPAVSSGVPSPDLLPSGSWAMRVDPGISAEEAQRKLRGYHPGATLHAPETPKDVVADTANRIQRRQRAELGFEHPYFRGVGDAFAKAWNPEAIFRSNSADLLQQIKKDTQLYMTAWNQRAAEYGRGHSPLADDVPTTAANNPLNSPSERMQQMQGLQALQNGIRLVERLTLKVIQDDQGRVLTIEIVSPSEDVEVDHLALKDVRSAALQLGRPPVELLDEQSHLVSLWMFEVVVQIQPPTSVGIDLDPVLGIHEPRVPFAKKISKRVKLLEGN